MMLPIDEPTTDAEPLLVSETELSTALRSLFASARDEMFEDGMESGFARELQRLIRQGGNQVTAELYYLVTHEKVDSTSSPPVNPAVAAEALRWLGLMHDPATYSYRLALLQRSLNSSAACVRDGELLGLSFMKDRKAIPHLGEAMAREKIPQLRRYMERVLSKLERMG